MPKPPIDLDMALRNIVTVLQERPADYRRFGVYWWPIKAMLKGKGYGPDDLTVLGDFMPPDAEDLIEETGAQAIMAAALREYQRLRFLNDDLSEDRDGQDYRCADPDANGL